MFKVIIYFIYIYIYIYIYISTPAETVKKLDVYFSVAVKYIIYVICNIVYLYNLYK